MDKYYIHEIEKSDRIPRLIEHLFSKMPEIEPARATLVTQSYMETENQPLLLRRAKAFAHILKNIPITIRPEELIVGSSTLAPRGCQTFPEFSFEWLESEFDTVENRSADPFSITEKTKEELYKANKYWKNKTTSDLAVNYMSSETLKAIEHNIFTVGNYFYNGVGHITVQYEKVLEIGYEGIIAIAEEELLNTSLGDWDYATKTSFLQSIIISCKAVVNYAKRYAVLARELAEKTTDSKRRAELLQISANCENVPGKGAKSFHEACQSFWFVQQLIQLESSGHSISPGRFDQYMYPYFKKDLQNGGLSREFAQELLDCIWVKLNDLNKCRDAVSAQGFAGYSLFQNLVVGGQNTLGQDATNDLSFMCITASKHVFLPQPSLSIRVWNLTPQELLIKAAELTKTGIGLPAYYNDEVVISSLQNRGLTLEDARDYSIIGCVEPQKTGKTFGWHDAAFFNMCRPLELVFSNGIENGQQVGITTGEIENMTSYDQVYNAYVKQMEYAISLLVNADNAIDQAHAERCPLPFLSSMVDDCIKSGKTVEQGGAVYNFTGPQGFGIANMADSFYAIKKLVFENKKLTLSQYKEALQHNFGKGFGTGIDKNPLEKLTLEIISEITTHIQKSGKEINKDDMENIITKTWTTLKEHEKDLNTDPNSKNYQDILDMIEELPKFGNDIEEVDLLARDMAYLYTRPLEKYKNPRGGIFQAGLYPVSANVPLGAQTGATPDGRLAFTPIADGVSPSAGRDINGPTAAANSVAKLDHGIASNGTLFNQKFHPMALSGENWQNNFIALIRSFFDQKGSHMQFNVVDRKTLYEAQENPEKYKGLVVRVAGYSALFTTLSKSLQDDIIKRTEQGFTSH